jgi:hypothetical protein
MNEPPVALRRPCQQKKEPHSVIVVEEDRLLVVSSAANVIVSAGDLETRSVHRENRPSQTDARHRLWMRFSTFVTAAAARHVPVGHG